MFVLWVGFDFLFAEVRAGPHPRPVKLDVPKAIASMPARSPWTHLGGFPLDAVAAQSVEFHRQKAQHHLDELEKMRCHLERAANERTYKAMPGPCKPAPALGSTTELESNTPSKASASSGWGPHR